MLIGGPLQQIDDASVIKVILVDCEIALINAHDSALPTVQAPICVWHINKAVMGKIGEIVPPRPELLLLWKIDVELISEKQATPISLPKSVFCPLINITEMVADSNCGFRAMAHIVHSRESAWPEVRQRLLDHLNSDLAGYLPDVAITSGAEISL